MGVTFLLLLLLYFSCSSGSSAPHLQPPAPLLPPGGGGDHLPHHQHKEPIPHHFDPGISFYQKIEYNQNRPNSGNLESQDLPDQQGDDRNSLASGILEGDLWEDDAGWWDGADEIDLTQSSQHYQDQYLFHPGSVDFDQDWYNQNVGNDGEDYMELPDCGDFVQDESEDFCDVTLLPPPPPRLMLPPPPIPPFLPGLTHLAQSQRMDALSSMLPPDDSHCVLCHWAEHGNESTTLFALDSDPDGGLAGLLAGVAVGSAVTGAILTAVLIRCRRSKVLPKNKESCPVISRGSWSKSLGGGRSSNNVGDGPKSASAAGEDTTTRTGWAMKLWRRGSSQERPLRPTSSYSSENSYTEEPYVNPDGSSALYAELAPGLNTYSEIPDPGRPKNSQDTRNLSDYGYENAGYALSEAPLEPSIYECGMSVPSSAYYSNVAQDVPADSSKRKKKKGGENELSGLPQQGFSMMPPSISSTIPMVPTKMVGNNACQSKEMVPLSLRLLPSNLTLERPLPPYSSCTPCQSCTPIKTMPIIRHSYELSPIVLSSSTINSIPLMSLNAGHASELASSGQIRGSHDESLLPPHLVNGISNGASNPQPQRAEFRSMVGTTGVTTDHSGLYPSSEYV